MILRSGNACSVLASLAARPTASRPSQHSLAPSHCSTLAKGEKENDDVKVHCCTAARLQVIVAPLLLLAFGAVGVGEILTGRTGGKGNKSLPST